MASGAPGSLKGTRKDKGHGFCSVVSNAHLHQTGPSFHAPAFVRDRGTRGKSVVVGQWTDSSDPADNQRHRGNLGEFRRSIEHSTKQLRRPGLSAAPVVWPRDPNQCLCVAAHLGGDADFVWADRDFDQFSRRLERKHLRGVRPEQHFWRAWIEHAHDLS